MTELTKKKLTELKEKYGKETLKNGLVTVEFMVFVVEHYEFRMKTVVNYVEEQIKGLKK